MRNMKKAKSIRFAIDLLDTRGYITFYSHDEPPVSGDRVYFDFTGRMWGLLKSLIKRLVSCVYTIDPEMVEVENLTPLGCYPCKYFDGYMSEELDEHLEFSVRFKRKEEPRHFHSFHANVNWRDADIIFLNHKGEFTKEIPEDVTVADLGIDEKELAKLFYLLLCYVNPFADVTVAREFQNFMCSDLSGLFSLGFSLDDPLL